jgi:hypothetical protein
MTYHKALLAQLILDVVETYSITKAPLHPNREKQIDKLRSLCLATEFDRALKLGILSIIQELQNTRSYWFSRPQSTLAIMLQDALIAYTELISLNEMQVTLCLEFSRPSLPERAETLIPIQEELLRESEALLGSPLSITCE